MVNHIQTLLANVSPEEAEKLGLGFHVDKHFAPQRLSQRLNQVRLDLLGYNIGESISAAFRAVSRLDLSKYKDMFDGRLDLRNSTPSATVVLSGEPVDFSKFMTQDNINYLFSKTRDTKTDELLDDLYSTLKNDVDGYNGLAAMILALVVRLDLSNGSR